MKIESTGVSRELRGGRKTAHDEKENVTISPRPRKRISLKIENRTSGSRNGDGKDNEDAWRRPRGNWVKISNSHNREKSSLLKGIDPRRRGRKSTPAASGKRGSDFKQPPGMETSRPTEAEKAFSWPGAPRGPLKMQAKKKIEQNKNTKEAPVQETATGSQAEQALVDGKKRVREVGKMEQKLWENVWLKGRTKALGFVQVADACRASTVTSKRNPTV